MIEGTKTTPAEQVAVILEFMTEVVGKDLNEEPDLRNSDYEIGRYVMANIGEITTALRIRAALEESDGGPPESAGLNKQTYTVDPEFTEPHAGHVLGVVVVQSTPGRELVGFGLRCQECDADLWQRVVPDCRPEPNVGDDETI